jgi:PAS domain S-box-containing protein
MEIQTSGKSQALTDKELIKILLVDDDEGDRRLAQQILVETSQQVKFTVESVDRLSTAIEYLSNDKKYDIVLLDLGLPDSEGLETFTTLHTQIPQVPIIVLSGTTDETLAIKAVQKGAQDYLIKGQSDGNTLARAICYAIERKKLGEKITHAAQEWRTTFDSILDMVSIHDTDFRLVRVNKAFANAFNTKPKELIGKTCYEVLHNTKQPCPNCPHMWTIKTHKPSVLEFYEPHLKIHLGICTSPIFDEQGKFIGSVHIAKDITERKKAEEQLKTSKASFHNIVEKSADGIIILDSNGIVQFANHSTEAIFGHKTEELVGEQFGFPIVAGEVMELNVIRQNRKPGIAEMRVVETQWENQRAWLALLRDITERKEAEEKLKETMKMKSEFTSTVSHELRTPLTAIKEGIAPVLDGLFGEINEEQKELLGIAKKNVDRLTRLINDVLDFQKLDAGKMKFDIQPHDINEIARDVYEMLALTAKDTGINFLLELDDSLPEIGFDSDKITQVLTNLVNNAMKFTEKGTITIKTYKIEDTVQVSVSDTGCGIRKEDLPKVFDSFEQLSHGGDRKTGGTGLGLTISKEIVERHGGMIWVESKHGKGSKFTFTLPICGTEGLLKKSINDGIREASKNDTKMSLILISIADFDKLEQKLPHEKIISTLKDIEAILENDLSRGRSKPNQVTDTVFRFSNEIFIVLTDCGKENIPGVKERLEQKLDDYLSQQNLDDKVRLLFGCAMYPDDASTYEDLIMKAKELQSIVPVAPSV